MQVKHKILEQLTLCKTIQEQPVTQEKTSIKRKINNTNNTIEKKYNSGKKHTLEVKKIKRKSGLFLAPSVIGVSLFFVLPFLVVIYYSMINNPIQKRFVFLDNFIRLLNNSAFRLAAANTLKFSLVAVPLVVLLSMAFAFALDMAIPFKSQIRTLLLSPMMVPIASVILIWQVLFHYNGVVNEFFIAMGGERIDWFKSYYAQVILVILFVWKNLGYNMILFIAAISTIPKELLEVAELENAKKWQIFFSIKIRYLSSTILFVTILSLINSFKVFREVYMLTGEYPFDSLYLLQHFMNNTFNSLDYQKLSAAAVILCIFMIIIIGLLFWVENHFGKDLEES